MHAYKHYIWILALLVAGCATMATPKSNAERLVFAEQSYQEILTTATLYREAGKLSASQISDVNKFRSDYKEARSLAEAAIMLGEQGNFDNQAATILTLLTTLRSTLDGVE